MENRYEKYKDSGIAWIGNIPEHWEVKRLKNVSDFNPPNDQSISNFSEVGYLPMERLKNGYMLPSVINVYNLPQGLTFFKENDIVMAKVTPCFENGNIAIAKNLINNCGFGSSELFIFRVRSINRKYFFYLLQEEKIKEVCKSTMIGTGGLKRISPTFMRNLLLPIPPILEQQSIAAYLDQKCSEIDELITLQEEMITKLQSYKQSVITEAVTKGLDKNVPLKDSDIEWIGEIPENWDITKIKNHYNVILGKMVERNNDSSTGGENYLCAANIKWNGVDTEINKKMYFSDVEKEKYLLQYNDVLIMEGGMAGTTCLYKNEFSPCYVQNSVNVCRAKKDFNNKFLYYWMYVPYYNGYIDTICNKATIKHYTKEKVQNTPILVPPLSEQQSIANYLDQKCSEIDELISIKQQKIEKLKDYKKSLIFECVTGKRKV